MTDQELAAIFQHVPGIVFYVAVEPNGDFRFLSMSEQGLAATGLSRDHFVGRRPQDVIPAPSCDLVLANYQRAIRERCTQRWREVSEYPAGRRVADVAVTPLYDNDGVPTRLIGIVHDITERERLEETLQQREARLRLALDACGGGSWTWDAGTNTIDWDEGFRARYGFPADEPPSHEGWLSRVFEEDRPQVLALLHEMLHTSRDSWNNTFRIVRPDGSVLWLESHGRAQRDANGQVTRLTGLDLDVTVQRHAEEALRARRDEEHHREMASELTLAEQHARQQLAKTLHDGLQQQLAVAAMTLEAVAQDVPPESSLAGLIDQVKTQLDEAIGTARSLSVELYPPLLHTEGLPAALHWLSEWHRSKYGLDVRVTADPLANATRRDIRILLFESVRELLFNVVKHARVNRVAVDMRIDANDMLSIRVSDEGVGFDETRLRERTKSGQAGWGLFSIRERLTLLGGRFEITSRPGEGTQFHLTAPRGGDLNAGVTPRPALRILIADDHAGVRAALRRALQPYSEFEVVGEAADGVEAIDEAHVLQPDVILMDISMPRMDGIEATRRVRAELPAVRILGMSMYAGVEGRHAIERAGAVGFFSKGVGTKPLLEQLFVLHAELTASAR